MRLPSAAHESRPWRIREIVPDFTLEDVWALPVDGGAEDFQTLLEIMTSGDPANAESLPARVLWRVRDRLRFCGTLQAAHDVVFTVAGGTAGAGTLYAIDAFEGTVRFASPLPGPDQSGDLRVQGGALVAVEGSPLVCGRTVAVVVRDGFGVRLVAFDRAGGALAWASHTTVAPSGT